MNIIVYSKPDCMQCNFIKKFLEDNGIEHDIIDVTENPDVLEKVKSWGFQSLPVVETPNETFFGFRPDILSTFKEL